MSGITASSRSFRAATASDGFCHAAAAGLSNLMTYRSVSPKEWCAWSAPAAGPLGGEGGAPAGGGVGALAGAGAVSPAGDGVGALAGAGAASLVVVRATASIVGAARLPRPSVFEGSAPRGAVTPGGGRLAKIIGAPARAARGATTRMAATATASGPTERTRRARFIVDPPPQSILPRS